MPDLAILLTGANRCLVDRLGAALTDAGFAEVRPPYGYVLRAVADRELTLTQLADLLGVTKQATLKVVDEMEARGLVSRAPHASDRRAKLIRLTPRAQAVRRRALATSHRIEAELREDLGDEAMEAARAVLLRFIERHGGLEDALARRARPVW